MYAAAAAATSLQSCPTLCVPIRGSPPGSSVPGILQARTVEWVAIFFSNAWKWKVKGKSCLTLRDSMDCSPQGSSIPGIFQARVLEWGAIAFSSLCIYRHIYTIYSLYIIYTQYTHWKRLMLGRIKGRRKGMTEDEMVGWNHWLYGHEFEQASGVGDGQRSSAYQVFFFFLTKCFDRGKQSAISPKKVPYSRYPHLQDLMPDDLRLLFSHEVMSNSLRPHGLVHQAALSVGFSRQEHWSGLPSLPPGDLPGPGVEPVPPALIGWATREAHTLPRWAAACILVSLALGKMHWREI